MNDQAWELAGRALVLSAVVGLFMPSLYLGLAKYAVVLVRGWPECEQCECDPETEDETEGE